MAFNRLKFNTDFEVWLDKRLSTIKSHDSVETQDTREDIPTGAQEETSEFGEFMSYRREAETTMSNPAGSKKSDSGNYYKSVWVGDDDDWDGSLTSLDYTHGSQTRDRVAQILKETELDEDRTVFTIPHSAKRPPNPATASLRSSGSFEERFQEKSARSGGTFTGNYDSLECLDSMHDFTENGYVEINENRPKRFQRRSNKDYFEDDEWSFDGTEGQEQDTSNGFSSHDAPSFSTSSSADNNKGIQSVRFRKFRTDMGQLEDNYIDDDEFDAELEGEEEDEVPDVDPKQLNMSNQPIARVILPMETEMEMELDDDVEMLDSDFRAEVQSDTQPIVDQANLTQEHIRMIKRSKRLRLGLFVIIVMIALGALGAIVYLIIHLSW